MVHLYASCPSKKQLSNNYLKPRLAKLRGRRVVAKLCGSYTVWSSLYFFCQELRGHQWPDNNPAQESSQLKSLTTMWIYFQRVDEHCWQWKARLICKIIFLGIRVSLIQLSWLWFEKVSFSIPSHELPVSVVLVSQSCWMAPNRCFGIWDASMAITPSFQSRICLHWETLMSKSSSDVPQWWPPHGTSLHWQSSMTGRSLDSAHTYVGLSQEKAAALPFDCLLVAAAMIPAGWVSQPCSLCCVLGRRST